MSIYRLLKCDCGRQSLKQSVPRSPICKCGQTMRVLPNYYIRYSVDGKRLLEAAGPDRHTAEKLLKKREGEVAEEKHFGKRSITWDQAVKRFLEAPNSVAAGTKAMYENSIRAFAPRLHGKLMRDISAATIADFIRTRLTSGATNSTINRDLSTLKRIISFCIDQGELPAHNVVLEKVKSLKENPARERILTPEEWERLLEECRKNPRLCLAVSIVSQTGLRKHGVYTLNWRDVHFEGKYIDKVVKGGKKVAIPMTDTLYDLLLTEKAKSESEWVLPSPDCQDLHVSMNSNLGFPEACKRAEIDNFRFHDLRHSFATLFVIRTGDKEACRVILGHSKSATTDKYVNIPDSHIRESMKKFEERE